MELSILNLCSWPTPGLRSYGLVTVSVLSTTELHSRPRTLGTVRNGCWTSESCFKAINVHVTNPSWLLKKSPHPFMCVLFPCQQIYCLWGFKLFSALGKAVNCLSCCCVLCTDSQILSLAPSPLMFLFCTPCERCKSHCLDIFTEQQKLNSPLAEASVYQLTLNYCLSFLSWNVYVCSYMWIVDIYNFGKYNLQLVDDRA